MSDQLLTVFDGTNLLIRSHFGVNRGPEILSTQDGRPSGALFTLINSFFSYIKDLNFSHTFWAFDKGRSSARLVIDSQYKANRDLDSLDKIDLTEQKVAFQEFLGIVGSKWYSEQNVEADDLIGQVVRFARKEDPGLPVVIVSSDHDLYQLVDGKTSVLKPALGAFSSRQLWTLQRVREEWNVDPEELPLLWALIGDCQPQGSSVSVWEFFSSKGRQKCDVLGCLCTKVTKFKREYYHCNEEGCDELYFIYLERDRLGETRFCSNHRKKGLQGSWVEKSIEQIVVGDLIASRQATTRGQHVGEWVKRSVEEVKKFYLDGDLLQVKTSSGLVSQYTENHRCMARLGGLKGKYIVYLMKRGSWFRVGKAKFNRENLYTRVKNSESDSMWVLEVCDSQEDALLREQIISFQFGIPDLVFPSVESFDLQRSLNFWETVGDLSQRGEECLKNFGRSIEFPFYRNLEGLKSNDENHFTTVLSQIRATNVIPGMEVLTWRYERGKQVGIWELIESVSRVPYQGFVYGLEVEGSKTYVSDGILTHNSGDNISGVRGVGPKTAQRFYKNAQAHYERKPNIHEIIQANSLKLGLYKNQILRAYQLVQLYSNLSELVLQSLDELLFSKESIDYQELCNFFEHWEFMSLIKRLEEGTLWN